MTSKNHKTGKWGQSRRTILMKKHRPTPEEQLEYAKEWARGAQVKRKGCCENITTRGCQYGLGYHQTRHGVFCRKHFIRHPRCTVDGCENLSCIDDGHNQAINPKMLCRDHLFEEDRRVPVPTWTFSMIGEMG